MWRPAFLQVNQFNFLPWIYFIIMLNNKNKQLKNYTATKLYLLSLILIIAASAILSACHYEKLGFSGVEESKNMQESIEEDNAADFLFTEQYFFELKSKQADKNPLSDLNIRKAIFYAIDRKRVTEELFAEYGTVLNSVFNPGSKYYYPAWDIYSYNPVKAKEYLKTAGYDIGNPLYLTIGAGADSPSRQVIEEIIKENLDDIGIKVWISNKESREWYVDYVKTGNYELGLWAIYTPDFSSLVNYFSSDKIPPMESDTNKNCNNYYWYSNKDFETLLNKILSENPASIDNNDSSRLQSMLAESAFILPLYSRIFCVAYNKKISGIDIDENTGSFLKNIAEMDILSEEDSNKDNAESDDSVEGIHKSLIVGYQQEPYLLNPFIPDNIYRDQINGLILGGLWQKKDYGQHEPLLVESIETGNGDDTGKDDIKLSLKAKIKLKNGIYWQDGTPITAYDVAASINAIKSDEKISYVWADYSNITSCEAVDEKEFTVTFKQYNANWKDQFSIIFPESMLEDKKISDLFAENIFGSGPFILKEWVKGGHIIVQSNPYYVGKKPEIDAIKFIFNSDMNYLISMLNEGNIDILNIPADLNLMHSIEEDEDLALIVKPGNLWEHLAIGLKPRQE